MSADPCRFLADRFVTCDFRAVRIQLVNGPNLKLHRDSVKEILSQKVPKKIFKSNLKVFFGTFKQAYSQFSLMLYLMFLGCFSTSDGLLIDHG